MFAVLDASFDTYTRSVGGCVLSRPVGERVVRRHAQRGPVDATGAELLAVGLLAGRAVPSGGRGWREENADALPLCVGLLRILARVLLGVGETNHPRRGEVGVASA